MFDSKAHDLLKNKSFIAKPIISVMYFTQYFCEYSPYFVEVQKFLGLTGDVLVPSGVYNYSKSGDITIKIKKRYSLFVKSFTSVKTPYFEEEKTGTLTSTLIMKAICTKNFV